MQQSCQEIVTFGPAVETAFACLLVAIAVWVVVAAISNAATALDLWLFNRRFRNGRMG